MNEEYILSPIHTWHFWSWSIKMQLGGGGGGGWWGGWGVGMVGGDGGGDWNAGDLYIYIYIYILYIYIYILSISISISISIYLLSIYLSIYLYNTILHNAILQCVTVHRVPKFTSCHNAIMVVTTGGHIVLFYCILRSRYILLSTLMDWVESLSERRSLCIMHRSLLAVWALWWLHNAILQCVTVHRVPKFTSCHNAIMVVTGRAHCSILLYIYIQYIYSGTPPYDHLVNTTTSLLRPLFFGPAKRPYIFL